MADSILFDGVDDNRVFASGGFVGTGALTAAAIIKPDDITAYNWLLSRNGLDAGQGGLLGWTNTGALEYYISGVGSHGATIPAANEWYLVAVTKTAGSTLPKHHIYRYSTSGWTHNNGENNIGNHGAFTSLGFGFSTGEPFSGNLLIAGVWDSALSDGTIETLISGMGAWATAAPAEWWRFDHAGQIAPPIGKTGFQTSAGGATLDAGDMPTGWTDTFQTRMPTTAVNLAGIGADWANPTNVTTSNDTRSTTSLAAGQASDRIYSSGYGFTISADPTGIQATSEALRVSGSGSVAESGVQLHNASGTAVGTNMAAYGWTTEAHFLYPTTGVTNSLWGVAWTAADINDADFGLGIVVAEDGELNSSVGGIDSLRIQVYYTDGGGGGGGGSVAIANPDYSKFPKPILRR